MIYNPPRGAARSAAPLFFLPPHKKKSEIKKLCIFETDLLNAVSLYNIIYQ